MRLCCALWGPVRCYFGTAPIPEGLHADVYSGRSPLLFLERPAAALFTYTAAMPRKPLPFSLKELRRRVNELDAFVKTAALDTMKDRMGPDDLGFPSTVVDELARLHGLLDLALCCVEEIETAIE